MKTSLESINEMYDKMSNNGWKINEKLKWGYFFFSKSETELKNIYSELVNHQYKIEEIFKNENNYWVMQVFKIEILEPDKLFRRCVAFNELADCFNSFYDGWDVGKLNS